MNAYPKTKRCLDIIFAIGLLVTLAPLMLAIVFAVMIESGRPVLFVQERVGLGGKSFMIYKFRTMREGIPSLAGDEQRITCLGKLLRASSLDELPQLVNVLKGDMSLVGPRPTLFYQVAKYNHRQRERLSVPPGLTGWAQVNRGQIFSWEDRIEMDLWYVQNRSLSLDLKILLKTIGVVLKRREIWVEQSQDSIAKMQGDEKKYDQ